MDPCVRDGTPRIREHLKQHYPDLRFETRRVETRRFLVRNRKSDERAVIVERKKLLRITKKEREQHSAFDWYRLRKKI